MIIFILFDYYLLIIKNLRDQIGNLMIFFSNNIIVVELNQPLRLVLQK